MIGPTEFDGEQDRRSNKGRRSTDNLELVDTSDKLTLEELVELKKLAQMSKIAKMIFGVIIGIISMFGISSIIDWFKYSVIK